MRELFGNHCLPLCLSSDAIEAGRCCCNCLHAFVHALVPRFPVERVRVADTPLQFGEQVRRIPGRLHVGYVNHRWLPACGRSVARACVGRAPDLLPLNLLQPLDDQMHTVTESGATVTEISIQFNQS